MIVLQQAVAGRKHAKSAAAHWAIPSSSLMSPVVLVCRCMGPVSVKLTGDLYVSVCQDEPMLRAHVATIRLADVGE